MFRLAASYAEARSVDHGLDAAVVAWAGLDHLHAAAADRDDHEPSVDQGADLLAFHDPEWLRRGDDPAVTAT